MAPGSGRLEAYWQGGSNFPASPDHHVRLFANGQLVDELFWDGKGPLGADIELAPGILVNGENILEIESVGDTGASYSLVFLDRFSITCLRVKTVPLEELFDEFGSGESFPAAIRDFLSHVYHHWREPRLRYVLLLGDATYDFKN